MTIAIIGGLAAFGVVFAMNSSIHSYLVLAYTDTENVSLNVGFYHMVNAAGCLLGTLLFGGVFLSEQRTQQECRPAFIPHRF